MKRFWQTLANWRNQLLCKTGSGKPKSVVFQLCRTREIWEESVSSACPASPGTGHTLHLIFVKNICHHQQLIFFLQSVSNIFFFHTSPPDICHKYFPYNPATIFDPNICSHKCFWAKLCPLVKISNQINELWKVLTYWAMSSTHGICKM